MDYSEKLKFHYRPKKGWINDPNGLVFFKGYYHIFYQHCPDFEIPWKQPMCWGHTITKDFINYEELPIALCPEFEYENNGCWSGTAIVKDDTLYLFYASVKGAEKEQTVSVAYSKDGINFKKHNGNPVIDKFPMEGGPDFRDPAICEVNGEYYCVMATGNEKDRAARLLLYKSDNLFDWEYKGIMSEWREQRYAECPSFINNNDSFLLTASVCYFDYSHYFEIMVGDFKNGKFVKKYSAEVDKGPDQYAGQVFRDDKGRNLLISWVSGWGYSGYKDHDIGCMSVPREIKTQNGKITAYPVSELRHLLKDEDDCIEHTENGFIVKREGREPLTYDGEIRDLKILRDGYVAEIFVNGGEEVYTVVL